MKRRKEAERGMEAKTTGQIAAVHLIVHGYVQGVGFRYFTQRQALQLGLTGWVRNRRDGTVEVWAEGPRHALDALIRAVRRGPSMSRVRAVNVTWQSPTGEHQTFRIRYV